MSICASGSSTTKPGTVTSIVVDGNYVKSLLPPVWSWLYDYLPYMRALAIGDVGAFCAADPPTWTLPNALDFYNFLTGGFVTQNDVVSTFLNKLTRMYLWYQLCQCSSGTTPAPSTPPPAPSGLPAHNPGNVVTSPAGACAHVDSPTVFNALNSVQAQNMIPFNTGAYLANSAAYPLPAGATTIVLTWTKVPGGSNHLAPAQVSAQFVNSSGANVGGINQVALTTTPLVQTVALPPTATKVNVQAELNANPTSTTDGVQVSIDIYCGTTPSQQSAPCCPPDPIATGLLQQILQLLTLVQRQAVPFAYVPGTSHATLSGTGSISVSGIVALSVSLTTIPTQLGDRVGTPPRLFDAGWVQLGTTDGYEAPVFISSSAQLIVPVGAGIITSVGYTFHSGVVATILELKRES